MIWNPHDSTTERANARIQYHPGFRKIANLSYRYIKGTQNQLDASILWPKNTWLDAARYEARARILAGDFYAHFQKAYGDKGIDPEVAAQCPGCSLS